MSAGAFTLADSINPGTSDPRIDSPLTNASPK